MGIARNEILRILARISALEDLGLLTVTAAGLALIDDVDAAAQRTTLGLGTAATKELTDWVAYTPTFTGFGTVSAVDFQSRRVGQNLEIIGQFTAGTTTATQARITMGYAGTNNNVVGSSTVINSSSSLAGTVITTLAGAVSIYTICQRSIGYLTFGIQGASTAGYSFANGSALVSSGNAWSIRASVPINGW